MTTLQDNHTNTLTKTWYLLQIKTQQRGRAQENLENQGFEFYSPSHRVKKIQRGKLQVRMEPLFQGYVFVQLNEQSDWRALQSTRGVTKVVSFNGRPQPVDSMLILALRQRFASERDPEALYKPGERVVIIDGCFKHIEAIVKAVTPDERIIVLLNILNSQQTLAMQATQLAKAS